MLVEAVSSDEGPVILDQLLRKRNRQLTEAQSAFVAKSISVEPTVLYLQLALQVVVAWPSSLVASEDDLVGGVRPLIHQLIGSLEVRFGKELVTAALGYITFSVRGVTDEEMIDLLSLDAVVMDTMKQYWDTAYVPSRE